MASHELMGGKLQVYQRGNSRFWQCAASVGGKQRRASTKEESLALAKQIAEDWYLALRGKDRAGLLTSEKLFRQVAEQFLREYEIITEGHRSPRWVEGHRIRLRLHLLPFFGELGVSEVTAGKVQAYRVHRMTSRLAPNPEAKDNRPPTTRPPARSTLHDEIVTLRQVLKTAIRHAWLSHLPDLSPPYKTQGKVVHRPWFRPDEARNLQHRDVAIVEDEGSGERILEIEVRGKRGVGFCKSMPSAVRPYERLLSRAKPVPTESRRQRQQRRRNGGNEPAPLPVQAD